MRQQMRRIKVLMLIVLSLFAGGSFGCLHLVAVGGMKVMSLGSMRVVQFKVEDQDHRPLAGETVGVSYQSGFVPSEGFGREIRTRKDGVTDEDGMVSFLIAPLDGEHFRYCVVDSRQVHGSELFNERLSSKKGRGAPIVIPVRLKRNPIPLVTIDWGEDLRIPKKDGKVAGHEKPLGYDMVAADWVAPYGRGQVADLIFRFGVKLYPQKDEKGRSFFQIESRVVITFPNEGDGVQKAENRWPLSRFPTDFEAPVDGYEPEFVMINHRGWHPDDFVNDPTQSYFVRIRTQKDENGRIVHALYGRITRFFEPSSWRLDRNVLREHFLNPTPLDRNLEYNGTPIKSEAVYKALNADYLRRFPKALQHQEERMRALPKLVIGEGDAEAAPK